jgi:hypothetical protein
MTQRLRKALARLRGAAGALRRRTATRGGLQQPQQFEAIAPVG